MSEAAIPVAVPQTATPELPTAQPVVAGVNEAPPQQGQPYDPALDGFQKIAAERRSRFGEAPLVIPFGTTTIRIHRQMPASFAFDALAAEVDAQAAERMIRKSVVTEDHKKFDDVIGLPPDHDDSIDGKYVIAFIHTLGAFYGGVPLEG